MTGIALRRLAAQRLTGEPLASAVDAVGWLGAVQSQDYGGAKWALGQRTRGITEADVDGLFDSGAILRTHVLRPTWHFLLPGDVRWLLELTGPRVKARLAQGDRQIGIDGALVGRSNAVIEAALRGGAHLTRGELGAALERSGIPASGQRLGHLAMHAELDGVIVSGPRRGRQFTYALLEERAQGARRLDRDEALAELTRRYFRSRGPAQVQDFTWWSGLTAADAKRGLALARPFLVSETIGDTSYWSSPAAVPAAERGPVVRLLPNYDEFLVAYRDRSAALDPDRQLDFVSFSRSGILTHVVVVDGWVRGCWSRRLRGRQVEVELEPLDRLDAAGTAALQRALDDLSRFLGAAVTATRAGWRRT